MGELVAFKTREGVRRRPADIVPGGAEILFFLGVRYERQDNALKKVVKKSGHGRPHGTDRPTSPGRKRRA